MTEPITINTRPLRVVWGSNSPLVPGGYGNTTALVVPRLRDRLGIEVAVSATYGHYGRKLTWQGIDIYPPGNELYNNDIHAAHARQHRADLLLTHQDVWTQHPQKLTARGTRWVSWHPLESEPVAPTVIERLRDYCYQPIALSKFGQQQAALAGLPHALIQQGIDTDQFMPGDRAAARQALGWPQGAFVVGMVARNTGYPSRKAYPQQLHAWAAFAHRHQDAWLYIHAAGDQEADPLANPIAWQLREAGLLDRVIWAHPYDLNGGYSTEQMVMRYQAMDALLSVSMAEGFCIPLLEAQACGVPVIAGAWSAMTENTYQGWLVASEDSEPWPVGPLECFWRLPHIGAIEACLEDAYTAAGRVDPVGLHHLITQLHSQDMLIDTQWAPVLSELARRIEAEPIPWHVHRWSGWAHSSPGGPVQACLVKDCPAEHRGAETAAGGFLLSVAGLTLDIVDDPNGGVRYAIADELVRAYRLPDLLLYPGEVVIDIGAHVGVVSCYLSKRWPLTRIYAFEPEPNNFARLRRNLEANGCANVVAINRAVSSDGRPLTLRGDPTTNTGAYSAYTGGPVSTQVESVALGAWLAEERIDRIALLKLDCEGAEYDILSSQGPHSFAVATLVMEVHENSLTRGVFGSGARLIASLEQRIPEVRATLITIPDPPGPLLAPESVPLPVAVAPI